MKLVILTLVLALGVPAYSENPIKDMEDLPAGEQRFSAPEPQTPLLWISHESQPDLVYNIRPTSRASVGVREFLDKLIQVAENPEVQLHFGLGMEDGNLVTGTGLTLATIFLSSAKCSTICRPDQGDTLEKFDLAPWLPGHRGTSITDSAGICGELSVAHGLVDRTVVSPGWAGVIRGPSWNDAYIHRVWKAAGSSTTGTTVGMQKRAFKEDWNSVWYNQCYSAKAPSEAGFLGLGGTSVRSWCRDLQDHVRHRHDACIFGLNGGGTKKRSGHAMYTLDAQWTGSKCVVRVVNTGTQGAPTGKNVPRDPGQQVWEVSGTAARQTIRNTAGSNLGFWNGMGYGSVDSVCCDEERKWWPDPPERKGKAWR